MSKQEISNLINKLNDLYEGVVIDGDDIGVKTRHKGFNFDNTYFQYIYKNTCLVRCTENGFYKTCSINYKASSKEEQKRIDAYKEYFLSEGYAEREIGETEFPNYFRDLNSAKELTPEDYLRAAIGFTDYDSVIESGRINEDYVYVAFHYATYATFQPRDKDIITNLNLNYLYILKVGKTLEDVVIFNDKSVMFQTIEELRVELAITISFLTGKEDNNIARKIESGNLYKECYYQVYSINEGYGGGYKYIIYEPQKTDEDGYTNPLRIDIKKKLDTFNEVMLDLVYYKKLFSINKFYEFGVDETEDLADLIKLDDATTIGDKLIGKTVDFGVFKNINEVDCVYEVFEINKEYGGGYGFFVWDLKGNLNTSYNYKKYAKTLEEVEDIIFFEKIALETHQLVQGNYSSSGLMGSNYSDYEEKQSLFSKIINIFKGL